MIVSEPPPCDGIDPAGASEEALRLLEDLGVESSGERAAGSLLDGVVGPSESRERVHDQHDVLAQLDSAARSLQDQLRDAHVLGGGVVEARGHDLADAGCLHLEDFLWTLVHQKDEQRRLRLIGDDAFGDGLEHHRLAGLGRGDDERALPLAERAEQVDDAVGEIGLSLAGEAALEPDLLVGMDGAEAGELGPAAHLLGGAAVDGGDLFERRATSLAAAAGVALDLVAGAKLVLPDDPLADVNVAIGGEVARLAAAEENRFPFLRSSRTPALTRRQPRSA